MLMLVMMGMNIISIFSVTRRYRSDVRYSVSEWVIVSIDLTDVTLVSEDTYGDDKEDEEDDEDEEGEESKECEGCEVDEKGEEVE